MKPISVMAAIKGVIAVVPAAAALCSVRAEATTFYAYSGPTGDFYTILSEQIEFGELTPSACRGSVCERDIRIADGDGTGSVTTSKKFLTDRTSTFQGGFTKKQGFYEAFHGENARFITFYLPEYEKGAYLYAFSTSSGSFAYMTPSAILSDVTFSFRGCGSATCEATIDNATGLLQLVGRTRIPISTPDGTQYGYQERRTNYQFSKEGFSSAGIKRSDDWRSLFVVALPDEYARASSTTPIAAVPEPATWAMMLAGFGMIGAAARYRRRKVAVPY